jgi:hypothetical protein
MSDKPPMSELVQQLLDMPTFHRQMGGSGRLRYPPLSGWNMECVCGAQWVQDEANVPFVCPREAILLQLQKRVVKVEAGLAIIPKALYGDHSIEEIEEMLEKIGYPGEEW